MKHYVNIATISFIHQILWTKKKKTLSGHNGQNAFLFNIKASTGILVLNVSAAMRTWVGEDTHFCYRTRMLMDYIRRPVSSINHDVLGWM
jgi:hypothetical protein